MIVGGNEALEDFGRGFEQRLRFRILNLTHILFRMLARLNQHLLDLSDMVHGILPIVASHPSPPTSPNECGCRPARWPVGINVPQIIAQSAFFVFEELDLAQSLLSLFLAFVGSAKIFAFFGSHFVAFFGLFNHTAPPFAF
jgi:hypothetical protein